jgi:predicted MPP superfamily phosphohydrolase
MIDWNLAKKMTLWNYEELIKRIAEVFSYSFIQEHYNHNMKEATSYSEKLLGYDLKHEKYVSRMAKILKTLEGLKVENYADLIHRIENKEKCEDFLRKTKLPFEDLILVINYVFRWVFPRRLYLRELIDTENECHKIYIEKLRNRRIRFNLDILENGRTREGRKKLSKDTGIPESSILDLVNVADMSRLPYSNRKTVKHLLAGGYDSVAKLAQTDSERIVEDMRSYFERIVIRLSGFVDLRGIAQWAKTMPIIVEN